MSQSDYFQLQQPQKVPCAMPISQITTNYKNRLMKCVNKPNSTQTNKQTKNQFSSSKNNFHAEKLLAVFQ